MGIKKHLLFILSLILLSLLALKTFRGPAYFDGHDAQAHLVRLWQYDLALKDGQYPPRWAGDLLAGHGYPVFIFAYPLPYALAEAFHLFGFSLPVAIKLTFVFSYLISSLTMYAFAHQYFKSRLSGFISALLWSWAPYIFVKVFITASLGVVVSYIFIPLTFLSLYHLLEKPNLKRSLYLSLALAGWLLSHLLTLLIFSPLILFFLLLNSKKLRASFKYLIISGLFALALAAWYLLPAVLELKYTHYHQFINNQYAESFVSLQRLLYSKWGTDAPGWGNNPISQQVGIAQWLAIALSLIVWLKFKKDILKSKLTPFLISFGLSIFLMLKISQPIWDLKTPLQSVSTPWRFLSLSVFTAAVSAGSVVKKIKNQYLLAAVSGLLLALALYGNRHHLRINDIRVYDQQFFDNYQGVATGWNEHLPIWVKDTPQNFPQEKVKVIQGECQISDLIIKSNLQTFSLNCSQASQVQINTAYYPGWNILLNRQNITNQVKANLSDSNGLIRFSLPSGTHQVVSRFQDTPLRQITKYISSFAWLLAIILWIKTCFKSLWRL